MRGGQDGMSEKKTIKDERRCDQQPGLFVLAETFCSYDMTDGFCTPRNRDRCECWDKAEAMLKSSPLSANACSWVLKNKERIEREANKGAAHNPTGEHDG